MQGGEGPLLLSLSPSFSSYSSGKLAVIAARVVEEFRRESDSVPNIFDWETPDSYLQHRRDESGDDCSSIDTINRQSRSNDDGQRNVVVGERDGGDDDFEFAVVPQEPYATSISAEDIFYNGQIRPIYPIFNTNLLLNQSPTGNSSVVNEDDLNKLKTPRVRRSSLGKLMRQESEEKSCSSSEADELDGLLPETYCVWSPKKSLERCKKSNSMSSSKRWGLRDLLHRSNSDGIGKDLFVFFTPNKKVVEESSNERGKSTGDERSTGKVKASRVAATATTASDEKKCTKNSATKRADMKRTTIPHRQDLLGLFKNSNGMN